MALIAKYVYNQEVTGSSNVTAWGNSGGAGLDLSVASGYGNAELVVVDTGNGVKNLVSSKDIFSGATKLTTSGNLGILTAGTIFIVGKQKVGTFENDTDGIWLNGSEILIDRDGSNQNVRARFGANTPTQLTRALSNDTIGIICFKFNASSQSLQVNNGTAATSSDVDAVAFNSPLELFENGLKTLAEVRIYDTELDGSTINAVYNELYNTYLSNGTAVITFPTLPTKTVGDADFAPGATSTNGVIPITYASSNPSVATIVSGQIHIVGAGTTSITASQAAGNGYGAAVDVVRTLTVNSNSNTNNMATNHVDGDIVGLFYSTVLDSPDSDDWKEIVCAENTGLDGSADVTSKRTKCGVIKSVAAPSFTVKGSGAANTTPGTGKASANELMALFQNGTSVLLKVAYATGTSLIFRQTNNSAVLSSYSETFNTGDTVSFDFTFDVTGDFDLTA